MPKSRSNETSQRNAEQRSKKRSACTAVAARKRTTKRDELIRLMSRKSGARMDELVARLGWQAHTVRSAISRLKSEHANVVSDHDGKGRLRYRRDVFEVVDTSSDPALGAAE